MMRVARLQVHRLVGWKMTTILKHANAKEWNRKAAKYTNNRAADPVEHQTQAHHPPRLRNFPRDHQ